LRDSKRDGAAALHVVSLVAHEGATILAQRETLDGDEVAALLFLLSEVLLKGRIISMDAGLLNAQVTQTIQEAHGDYVGSVKGNQAEVLSLLDEWVAEAVLSPSAGPPSPLPVPQAEIAPPRWSKRQALPTVEAPFRELRPRRAPDARTIEKSRGRLEIRELWVVEAAELGLYLADEWGWVGVAQIGWLRRWRKKRSHERWKVEQVTVVISQPAASTPPARFLALMCQHWSIENQVHWPRDMSFHEARLHGRQIGVALAWLRNVAINLMRRRHPGVFLSDVRSELAAHLPVALRWMLAPVMN
jgi:predicted transposase YbfD/YdcC